MQKRPRGDGGGGQAQLGGHAVLFVQRQGKVKQLGVVLANQACQRNGGAHVRQRIVRGFMVGEWPYWFLNPAEVGPTGVALYILGFTVFGLVLAFMLILLRRLAQKLTGNLANV